jgi:hypothetical protein
VGYSNPAISIRDFEVPKAITPTFGHADYGIYAVVVGSGGLVRVMRLDGVMLLFR